MYIFVYILYLNLRKYLILLSFLPTSAARAFPARTKPRSARLAAQKDVGPPRRPACAAAHEVRI
jgi:hypothetical protein